MIVGRKIVIILKWLTFQGVLNHVALTIESETMPPVGRRSDHTAVDEDDNFPFLPVRSSLARAVYLRKREEVKHRQDDHAIWYRVDVEKLPDELRSKFLQCCQDNKTTMFLDNCFEKADWIFTQLGHSFMGFILSWFMTQTTLNGYLGRGSMFVFSDAQFSRLLGLPPAWHAEALMDLGAGDGVVTQEICHHFDHTYVTEASWTMVNRLSEKGFSVLGVDEWSDGQRVFDVISCLNLLDRCSQPLSILRSIRRSLRLDTGRAIIALVLPFKPYVEEGSSDHKPEEVIMIQGSSFEEQVASLVNDVFHPIGFEVTAFTRLPYLCEGDLQHSFYVLQDAVFTLKVSRQSKLSSCDAAVTSACTHDFSMAHTGGSECTLKHLDEVPIDATGDSHVCPNDDVFDTSSGSDLSSERTKKNT